MTGGTDKGLSFRLLADTLDSRKHNTIPVSSLYLLGGTGTDKLVLLLDQAEVTYKGPYDSLDAMLQAVKTDILKKQENGRGKKEVAVFSPGATSFGMFSNEFDRGNRFMEKVKELFSSPYCGPAAILFTVYCRCPQVVEIPFYLLAGCFFKSVDQFHPFNV